MKVILRPENPHPVLQAKHKSTEGSCPGPPTKFPELFATVSLPQTIVFALSGY